MTQTQARCAEASPADWLEWKRVCALGGCSDPARDHLQRFAHHRFLRCVERLRGGRWSGVVGRLQQDIQPSEAWHLFESHLEIRNTRGGKRYKDWLFARLAGSEDAPQAVLEGGASLIIRDVVREHLRREWQAGGHLSLEAPVRYGDDGEGPTLRDLLPATEDALGVVARREYTALAAALAERTFDALPLRTRVSVLAKTLELNLHDPRVLTAAQCGKSVLNEQYATYRRELRARVECEFADEDHAGRVFILCQSALGVQERVFLWSRTQPHCAPMLRAYMREAPTLEVVP